LTNIFGGGSANDFRSYSNIVFSNRDLDPWSSDGVLENINEKLIAIYNEKASHHLDLRSSNENDPESVVLARLKEIEIIQNWINEYYLLNK
jgi:hypothetical protein